MSIQKAALADFRVPYWNGFVSGNLDEFQNKVTDLLEELRKPETVCPSMAVLGRIAQIFSDATRKYRWTRNLTLEESQVYSNLREKLVEWQRSCQSNIHFETAIESIQTFVQQCVSLPQIHDPFNSDARLEAVSGSAQPALIPLHPPAPAKIVGDTYHYDGIALENLAGEIKSGNKLKFEFVDCSYQPVRKERTDPNALIDWERATELKFSGFKTAGLDLGSATNLETLVIENSPNLQSLVLPPSPNLKRVVLKNNAALNPEALYPLFRRPRDQLIKIEVIINGCPKITQETAKTLIKGGLIRLDYTPSQLVGHLHKTLKVPGWLMILGIGLLALAGLKLINFLQRHFFKAPLRG